MDNNTTPYTEEFIARAKDFAVLGLQPIQIAERLELRGKERDDFLQAVCNKNSPLHLLINIAYANGGHDLDAALTMAAVSGDVDALELAIKKRDQERYFELRMKLFGI